MIGSGLCLDEPDVTDRRSQFVGLASRAAWPWTTLYWRLKGITERFLVKLPDASASSNFGDINRRLASMSASGKRPDMDIKPRLTHVSDLARWGVTLEAGLALAVASLLTRTLPFKSYIHRGSIPLRKKPSSHGRIEAKLVDSLANRVPFRAVCLQRGLALQWMLRRRGIDAILHYGIRIKPEGLEAHVWVSLNEDVIIGAPQHQDFKEVAKYPASVSKPQ